MPSTSGSMPGRPPTGPRRRGSSTPSCSAATPRSCATSSPSGATSSTRRIMRATTNGRCRPQPASATRARATSPTWTRASTPPTISAPGSARPRCARTSAGPSGPTGGASPETGAFLRSLFARGHAPVERGGRRSGRLRPARHRRRSSPSSPRGEGLRAAGPFPTMVTQQWPYGSRSSRRRSTTRCSTRPRRLGDVERACATRRGTHHFAAVCVLPFLRRARGRGASRLRRQGRTVVSYPYGDRLDEGRRSPRPSRRSRAAPRSSTSCMNVRRSAPATSATSETSWSPSSAPSA